MSKSLVWFRRDLRDYDHAALYHALKHAAPATCVFVFDTDILDTLTNRQDKRVEFIWESVRELKHALQQQGSDLLIRHGRAVEEIPKLACALGVESVYCNHDYEPACIARDKSVQQALASHNITFHSFKDQVIFEQDEILTKSGTPFSVFTPYKNAWLRTLNDFYLQAYPVGPYLSRLATSLPEPMPTLESLGFEHSDPNLPALPTGMSGGQQLCTDFRDRMQHYRDTRDFPAIKGPSYLSVHLRFGTVSIRQLASAAYYQGGAGAETWLSELIWRDFYFQILHHHPHIAHGRSFKPEFEQIPFSNDRALFQAWCNGKTGYPLVDAAMRQLNQTGYMHNRLRMITASFLVKDLLVDWRWGERYFATHLIDFDLAANNGGWQWAASTGCDAQPWFRIFNPVTQSEKFDPRGKFIRKYVPELKQCDSREIHAPWLIPPLQQQALKLVIGENYPAPIVNHALQRERALALYKTAGSPP
ncbi:deoxyribodipyrimidine photo-lyase type I [Methylobacillus rhizosphaerae]|uniref:Deoxyribodipyrimidine photo-lyase n=1 Tax=Methylobacillus rhizosphaerae TaxID=551994 RepID=A0A239B3V9_9PROT|nr:deoxyribodipyrimidine photo-lyase [Methylobacillus rhizosphaerae]SNS02222.1 deoxyribodipyrimidine photo-lyase type I [Methylobacillus rhizosphaerae]